MEPAVAIALITAGTKIAVTFFEKWTGGTEDQKVTSYVGDHYDDFHDLVSDNSMKILRKMEDGQKHKLNQLFDHLYPNFEDSLPKAYSEHLISEFEYRLFYLQLLGVIVKTPRDYYITPVGKAFISKARDKHHYDDVLFG